MKIINPSYEIWGECPCNKEDTILRIEKAGRVCYRSEDNIVPGSGKTFVENIWKKSHFSVIEHSNIVLISRFTSNFPIKSLHICKEYYDSKYFNFVIKHDKILIAGNWRAWIEWYNNNYGTWGGDCNFDSFPKCLENESYRIATNDEIPNTLKAITVEFITDRAVTHELVRHRPPSYSQESQRYVKYDGGMTFVKPSWYDKEHPIVRLKFDQYCKKAEEEYKFLRDMGLRPEQARVIIPNATATKIIMTAYIPEWIHVFSLRTSNAAYSDIRNLMIPLQGDFRNNGWIN